MRRLHLLGILALVLSPAVSLAQDSLERGLLRQAPDLVKHFQKQGYKNVGVLKFLTARDGDAKAGDNIGTLNLLAARRLELALILANDPQKPVGIIENASAVARTIAGASHLSMEGRQKLFAAKYPLCWGKERVQPDAFVTGVAHISKDLRTLTLTLFCFDRTHNKLEAVGADFQVANDPARLAEMGESFTLRGAFDDGMIDLAKKRDQALQLAVKVRDKELKHPAQLPNQPVTLEIYYDDVQVPLEFRAGKAFIPEPREGQKVELGLGRDKSKVRYGVVLKVNGLNTLDKERLPDVACRKWVLDPGEGPWSIHGFQVGQERERFRVTSPAESKEREVNYGSDVGTITMTVFREGKPAKVGLSDIEQKETVLQKLASLPERPMNHGALVQQLLADANRGLIVEGQKEPSKVRAVEFRADPEPIMTVTVVYYRK